MKWLHSKLRTQVLFLFYTQIVRIISLDLFHILRKILNKQRTKSLQSEFFESFIYEMYLKRTVWFQVFQKVF